MTPFIVQGMHFWQKITLGLIQQCMLDDNVLSIQYGVNAILLKLAIDDVDLLNEFKYA